MQGDTSRVEKELQWAKRVHDSLPLVKERGRSPDPEITEALLLLNVLGISAVQGFIGTSQQASHAPYVIICRNDLSEEQENVRRAWDEANKQEKLKHIPKEEIYHLFGEARKMEEVLICKQLKERRTLLGYLTRFYSDREVPYDRFLTLQDMRHSATLESQGAQFLVLDTPEVRLQKLREYQREMREFTEFLKEIFLTGGVVIGEQNSL